MNTTRAHEEIIDFIASGTNPANVVAFRPSDQAKSRVSDLIEREKTEELSIEETVELDDYLKLEHLMRMAKVRARHFLKNE